MTALLAAIAVLLLLGGDAIWLVVIANRISGDGRTSAKTSNIGADHTRSHGRLAEVSADAGDPERTLARGAYSPMSR